jgi:hypothetical protein
LCVTSDVCHLDGHHDLRNPSAGHIAEPSSFCAALRSITCSPYSEDAKAAARYTGRSGGGLTAGVFSIVHIIYQQTPYEICYNFWSANSTPDKGTFYTCGTDIEYDWTTVSHLWDINPNFSIADAWQDPTKNHQHWRLSSSTQDLESQ